ncbi:hypothetical protein ACFW17_35285 [Streptomyces sp. NPDC058961]|uniref:hypothetical protein n=1 Tax=unclassified Streptomyces TaxID=2593676 RepID=UPI00331B81F8
MRKAFTASAVAIASALALAAPATAFAAGSASAPPNNSASPTDSASPSGSASPNSASPTDSASPSGSPTPTPATPSVALSSDTGRPGDKITVTIRQSGHKGTAYVVSKAFGGRVNLAPDAKTTGVWHGTATVANYPRDYFGVQAFVDGKLFDTVKFTVGEPKDDHKDGHKDDQHGKGDHDGTPPPGPHHDTTTPRHHTTPKGGVNTGVAPAPEDHTATNSALALGITGLGATALGGAGLLSRRGRKQD